MADKQIKLWLSLSGTMAIGLATSSAAAQQPPPPPEPQQQVQQENAQQTPSGKIGKEEPSSHSPSNPTTAQQATETTLERRIENALQDLDIFNARAYKPDNLQATEVTLERMIENAIKDLDPATARTLSADERLNEVMRKSGIYR
jgi:hypothetical protein